jgi:hypothetical protein
VQELGRWSSVISSLRGLDSAVLFLENVDAGRGAAMLDGDQAGTKALHSCWACVSGRALEADTMRRLGVPAMSRVPSPHTPLWALARGQATAVAQHQPQAEGIGGSQGE